MLVDVFAVNALVQEEAKRCTAALNAEMQRVGIKSTGNKVTFKLTYRDGLVTRIKFTFPRYLVYVAKGASRGHGGRKGSQWQSPKGITIKTNPKSFNKLKEPKDWFNPVINNFSEQIAEKLKTYYVTVAFGRLNIQ